MKLCYICDKPVLISTGGEVSWGVNFEESNEGKYYHLVCFINQENEKP